MFLGSQPAFKASSGSHEMSPCLKVISGVWATEGVVATESALVVVRLTCLTVVVVRLTCLTGGLSSDVCLSSIDMPNRKMVKDKLQPSNVFKCVS